VTPRILKEPPSILSALEAAGKRCRKSKDDSVIRLLSSWREKVQNSKDEDATTTHISSSPSEPVASQAMVAVAPATRMQAESFCML
jgi:hypothetical protein